MNPHLHNNAHLFPSSDLNRHRDSHLRSHSYSVHSAMYALEQNIFQTVPDYYPNQGNLRSHVVMHGDIHEGLYSHILGNRIHYAFQDQYELVSRNDHMHQLFGSPSDNLRQRQG